MKRILVFRFAKTNLRLSVWRSSTCTRSVEYFYPIQSLRVSDDRPMHTADRSVTHIPTSPTIRPINSPIDPPILFHTIIQSRPGH